MGQRQKVPREKAVEAVRRLRYGDDHEDWYPEPKIWQSWPLFERRQWLNASITSMRAKQELPPDSDGSPEDAVNP
ncbi:hypothetical protein KJ785_04310 [Patescibacteria group bacterium]|nr:hypothetical protein [Patescibacteria group bacterium]